MLHVSFTGTFDNLIQVERHFKSTKMTFFSVPMPFNVAFFFKKFVNCIGKNENVSFVSKSIIIKITFDLYFVA